jgi:hypothetical protein
MLRLLKYELRKTLMAKLILLAITAVAEAVFLYGLWGKQETPLVIGAMLLFLIATSSITLMGILSLVTLHKDMNTKQGYMLFMTPNSCYSILGAKVVETSLSILITGAFFFALGALDITLLFARYGQLMDIWRIVTEFIRMINQQIQVDAKSIAMVLFLMLSAWISVICTVFLADVISAALLNGRRHNGLVSFIFFIILSVLTAWLSSKIAHGIDPYTTALVVQGAIDLAIAAVMYFVTAQIMERRLSV